MPAYIPQEITREILVSIPVKSLLRFRCVCRDWHVIISSPDFTAKHLSRNSSSPTAQTLVRYYSKLHKEEIFSLYSDDVFTGRRTLINSPWTSKFYSRIVGYCNGVFCLSDDLFGYKETIILWNPSIRRAVTVPTPGVTSAQYGSYMFVLGFGYDSVTDDYKIVRMAYLADEVGKFPLMVEVFSVSLGEWRLIKSNTKFYIVELFWSQAVRDSVVHWVGYIIKGKKGRILIILFDLSTEIFGEMSLPESLERVHAPIYMYAHMLGGLLSILCRPKTECICSVWVMKDYGNVGSWVNLYKVDLTWGGRMVSMPRNNGEAFITIKGVLASYNCENKIFRTTGIQGTDLSFFVDMYVESLVLLGKGREVKKRGTESDYKDQNRVVEMEEKEQIKIALRNNCKTLTMMLNMN